MAIKRALFILNMLICLVFASQVANAADREIVLSIFPNFKPVIWEESGHLKGMDVDVVRELGKRIGVDFKLEIAPWKRCLENAKNGTVDGVVAAFKTKEREQYAFFAEVPYRYAEMKLFMLKERMFAIEKVSDLYDKTIGIRRAFSIGEEFDAAAEKKLIDVEPVSKTGLNVLKLTEGRLDGLIGNSVVVQYIINQRGFADDIVMSPFEFRPREETGIYIMISKAADTPDKQGLLRRISDGISEMRDDGTLDRITASYLK